MATTVPESRWKRSSENGTLAAPHSTQDLKRKRPIREETNHSYYSRDQGQRFQTHQDRPRQSMERDNRNRERYSRSSMHYQHPKQQQQHRQHRHENSNRNFSHYGPAATTRDTNHANSRFGPETTSRNCSPTETQGKSTGTSWERPGKQQWPTHARPESFRGSFQQKESPNSMPSIVRGLAYRNEESPRDKVVRSKGFGRDDAVRMEGPRQENIVCKDDLNKKEESMHCKLQHRQSFCDDNDTRKKSPRDSSMARDHKSRSLDLVAPLLRNQDRSPPEDIVQSGCHEIRNADSFHSSSSSSRTPRDNRRSWDVRTPNEGTETPTHAERMFSIPNCLTLKSIPTLPTLDHPDRRRQNSLQNRWVPPTKYNDPHIPRSEHVVLDSTSPRSAVVIKGDEWNSAKMESPNKNDMTISDKAKEVLVRSCIHPKEDINRPTCASTPANGQSLDTIQTPSNVRSNLEKSTTSTAQRQMAMAEPPTPEMTDSSFDSSRNHRLKSQRVLPLAHVVSESPHSSTNSYTELPFRPQADEPVEDMKLDLLNHTQEARALSGSSFNDDAVSSDDDSDVSSDTDEEELMQWARTMFGIPQGPPLQILAPQQDMDSTDVSSDEEEDYHFRTFSGHHGTEKYENPLYQNERNNIGATKGNETSIREMKAYSSLARKKRPKETKEQQLKRLAEAKIKKEQAKAPTPAELQVILGNDEFVAPSTNWVRRSVRQPASSALTSTNVKSLVDKLKSNDSDMVVLKMKKYINDPDTPSVVIDAALDALGDNSNCEALYIQNFNKGMRDEQVLRLLDVLMLPTCKIWCLNIGETYNVKTKTWKKFASGLKRTNVTHMYASEHTISGELKDRIRETIRNNRKKHDKHSNPNNLDVIVQCTHCWWNPMNTRSLRPYLKNKGYEQLLLDKEAQGLQGSTSGAALR